MEIPNNYRNMRKGVKILLVEDNHLMRETIELALERQIEEPEVDCVANGKAATKQYEHGEYDCIISDLEMPKVDGLELCEEVLSQRECVFILYTASRQIISDADTSRVGADEIINKGTSGVHELAARVTELINNTDTPISGR